MGSTTAWQSEMSYNQNCDGTTSPVSGSSDAVYSTCKFSSGGTGWFATVSSPSASIRGFRVLGNLGCDGQGSIRYSSNSGIISSGSFYAHWKNVACNYDPSVNHLIISTDPSATHSISSNTNLDNDIVTYSTGVPSVFYLMWAGRTSSAGVPYGETHFQGVLDALANGCSSSDPEEIPTQCDFSNGRGWTLVYKIAGLTDMRTTGSFNMDALREPVSDISSGKLNDVAIRELCAGQFRIDHFYGSSGSVTSRSPNNPIFCNFVDASLYADDTQTAKYCSEDYDENDNYDGQTGCEFCDATYRPHSTL